MKNVSGFDVCLPGAILRVGWIWFAKPRVAGSNPARRTRELFVAENLKYYGTSSVMQFREEER